MSRLLSKNKKLLIGNSSETTLDHERASEGDRYFNGEILAGALDAVNLPGDESPPIARSNSLSVTTNSNNNNTTSSDDTINEDTTKKDDDTDYYCRVKPSKAVEEKSKILPFDQRTIQIQKNLKMLDWEIVWVYIRTFNAHGGIICRQNVHTTEAGEATIQHFIDTTHF